MNIAPLTGLTALALLLLACADDTAADDAGGAAPGSTAQTGASTGSSPGLPLELRGQGCDDASCWVIPVPQGNQLLAMRSLPGGVAYGVGAHGAFVRWDGQRWTSAALPDAFRGPALVGLPHLRGVAPAADDDVWAVGDLGTVLHYDGQNILAAGPDATPSVHYLDVVAHATDDVWTFDRAGRIHHFDGNAWTTAFDAGAEIIDVWMPSADELWALAEREDDAPFTVHFDGTSFSVADVPDGDDLLLASGRAVAIAGHERGRPWVAFESGLLRRNADGSWETLYDPSYQPPHATPTDLMVTGPDEAYLATPDTLGGTVSLYQAGEMTHPTVTADLVVALGRDGDTPWFLGPGGSIESLARPATNVAPTVTSVPATINDPLHATLCAPSSDAIFCAVSRGEDVFVTRTAEASPTSVTVAGPFPHYPPIGSIHANAAGDVVVSREEDVIAIPAGEPSVTIPVSPGDFVDVRQAVVLDDGSMLAVKISCDLFRTTGPGAAAHHVTYADPRFADELRFCRLHAHPGNVAYVTGWYSTTGTDDGLRLVVIRADDATTIFDAALPEYFYLDTPVTVTATGTPWIALDVGGWQVFVGNGNGFSPTSFKPLDAPHLAARGEGIFAVDPGELPASVLRRLDDASFAPLVMPLHRAASLAAATDRVWVQSDGAILSVRR